MPMHRALYLSSKILPLIQLLPKNLLHAEENVRCRILLMTRVAWKCMKVPILWRICKSIMLIKVKAFPGARKEKVVALGDHAYEMYVREPAERNMANNRFRQLVAVEYQVPLAQVRMQSGARSRSKVFVVL